MFKKIASVVMLIALLMTCGMIPAQAVSESDDLICFEVKREEFYDYSTDGVQCYALFGDEIIDYVAHSLWSGVTDIDMRGYELMYTDHRALMDEIRSKYPLESVCVAYSGYSIGYSGSTGLVSYIMPAYTSETPGEEFSARLQTIGKIVNGIRASVSGRSDFEKLLHFHDYLVRSCTYDYSYKVSDAYNMLTGGKGVCQAYAESLKLLCDLEGIPCVLATSRDMNHAWNMVELEGQWYHIDATWDDPTPDTPGTTEYTYFLRTDAEMLEQLKHYGWTPEQPANGTKYKNMPHLDGEYQMFSGGYWYFISGGAFFRSDQYGNNRVQIASSVSGMDVYDGKYYYTTGRNIMVYNPKDGTNELLYTMTEQEAGDLPNDSEVRLDSISISESGLLTYRRVVWQWDGAQYYYLYRMDGLNPIQLAKEMTEVQMFVGFYGAVGKAFASASFTPVSGGEAVIADISYTSGGGSATVRLPAGEYSVRITKPGCTSCTLSSFTVGRDVMPGNLMLYAGDLNGNNKVDLIDASMLAAAYGKKKSESGYNAAADYNGNGVIDLMDASQLVANYGKTGMTL